MMIPWGKRTRKISSPVKITLLSLSVMGISYLTKHLLPYAETVSLGRCADQVEPPRVQAVVIDGPSLVYHIYDRLLASTDPSCDVLDVQPTCDEVSRGVVSCLLQMARLGVEM